MINEVLQPFMEKSCQVYKDNILVYSKSVSDHSDHLRQLSQALRMASLKVNFKKNDFLRDWLTLPMRAFDGRTKTTKVDSAAHTTQLASLTTDTHFVCYGGGRSLPSLHHRPRQKDQTHNSFKKEGCTFGLDTPMQNAYNHLVSAMALEPVLTLPDFNLYFELHIDASHYRTGSILYQHDPSACLNQRLCVTGYYSYMFSNAEVNY